MLDSCVGIALFDQKSGPDGLTHVMMPRSIGQNGKKAQYVVFEPSRVTVETGIADVVTHDYRTGEVLDYLAKKTESALCQKPTIEIVHTKSL